MNKQYLNPGPTFLRWLAGVSALFILMSLVLIQWQGFSGDDDSSMDDDDSSIGEE